VRRWWLGGMAPLALWAGAALAQDRPVPPPKDAPTPRPQAPGRQGDEELTPERAMTLLREVRELQDRAAELLGASAEGKALETERALDPRRKGVFEGRDTAEEAQTRILERIERLLGKSEGRQRDAAAKMAEILRRAKAGPELRPGGRSDRPREGCTEEGPPQAKPAPERPVPARKPGEPPGGAIHRFESTGARSGAWGRLPARLREPVFFGKRDLDDYPAEFQELLKEYFREMTGGGK
jgi:hypothetical protein